MAMTSRERLLCAMAFEPVDRVPLLLRFWTMEAEEDQIPLDWRDEVARAEATLALGLDDTIMLDPPLSYAQAYLPEALDDVTSTTGLLPPAPGESHPRLTRAYETPDGTLQMTVALTGDWPYGHDLNLFDDHNIPRLTEPLVKTVDDLSKLQHLLGRPSAAQVDAWRGYAADLRGHANRLGVVLDGGWVALGDMAMWLCGMERMLYAQMDEPAFVEAVLDVLHAWEMMRLAYLLEDGVDVIVHGAWYETTDFWTPRTYRRFLKPRLMEEIETVHQAGAKFRYILTKGWRPYIPDLIEMGIDCLTGVDPVQDNIDLAEVKATLGRHVCLMGGLNAAVMLDHWSDAEIEHAVDEAIAILAPGGGYIGYPVEAVYDTTDWRKVEVLLARWRRDSQVE